MKNPPLKNIVNAVFLAMLLTLVFQSRDSEAAGPWHWKLTLTGTASGKAMDRPQSLYCDEDKGRYYVVDAGNGRLLSFDRQGVFLSALNAGGQLQDPVDMTRDGAENLLVVEKGKNSLTVIDLKKQLVTPNILQDQGRPVYPERIERLGDAFLLLDRGTGRILRLDDSYAIQGRFACEQCGGGFVDFTLHEGEVWALAPSNKAVYRFSVQGDRKGVINLVGGAGFPVSMAVGPSGRIYVLDRHENAVFVYDQSGAFKYRFLSRGQTRGRIFFPTEIRFDPWGNLCVVEEGNGRVQLFGRQ